MKKLQQYFFVLLTLAAISFPALEQSFHFMTVKPLFGVVEADTLAGKRSTSWWDRGLQNSLEAYSSDSMSLRPSCVRLRNQLEFSVFDKINAHDIYEHHGIFYRYTYATYNERDEFVGTDKVSQQVKILAGWQQKLGKKRVPIYVVITASKLSYYRDELPWYNKLSTSMSNEVQYTKALQRAGIEVLDANAWFAREKKHTNIPLMARGGVHWTLFGAATMMDSLVKRITKDKQQDFQQVEMTFSDGYQLYEPDNDAMNLSNLMSTPEEKALRVVFFPEPKQLKKKIRAVVVSDSFFDVIDWTPLHSQVLDPATPFYYYFKQRSSHSEPFQEGINDAVFASDVEHADCIIIITDIQNMHRFGFGLVEYVEGNF